MQSRVASFLGGVQLKMKVDQATSSSDDAAPIYLLDEVVQAAGSRADSVSAVVEAMERRLKHRDPNVKQKALRLVRHAAQKGSAELRRALTRHSAAVRELRHFRCEPDAFKGDAPWKKVQELAAEALDALHAAPDQAALHNQQAPSLGGRIRGFGSGEGGTSSSSGGGGSGTRNGGGGGMMGFGSSDVAAGGYSGGASTSGGGGGGASMLGFSSGDTQRAQQMLGSFSDSARALGERALGAVGWQQGGSGGLLGQADGYSSAPRYDAGGGGSSYSQPPTQLGPSGLGGGGSSGSTPSAATANGGVGSQQAGQDSAERRLVERICTPAGLRAAPERSDLQAFVEGLSQLDGALTAQLLRERVERGPWQPTLRALCAIEAAADHSSAACAQLVTAFRSDPSPVRRATESLQASVRQRALKLLLLLGGAPGGSTAVLPLPAAALDLLGEEAEAGGAPASASSSAPDLLQGGAGSSGGAATQPPPLHAPPASALDLLAGLAPAAAPQPASAPAAGGDLLAGLSTAPRPSSAAAPAGGDLFAGLDLPPSAQRSGFPAPAAAAAASLSGSAGGLGDLLGGLSLSPPPPPQQQAPPLLGSPANGAALADLFSAPLPAAPLGASAQPWGMQQQQQQGPKAGVQPMGAGASFAHPPVQPAHGLGQPMQMTGLLPDRKDSAAETAFSFVGDEIAQLKKK